MYSTSTAPRIHLLLARSKMMHSTTRRSHPPLHHRSSRRPLATHCRLRTLLTPESSPLLARLPSIPPAPRRFRSQSCPRSGTSMSTTGRRPPVSSPTVSYPLTSRPGPPSSLPPSPPLSRWTTSPPPTTTTTSAPGFRSCSTRSGLQVRALQA